MKPKRLLVCVVDDDESVRESLPDLVKQLGYDVRAFASRRNIFLLQISIAITDCLILDINMPGVSGPDLQRSWGIVGRISQPFSLRQRRAHPDGYAS